MQEDEEETKGYQSYRKAEDEDEEIHEKAMDRDDDSDEDDEVDIKAYDEENHDSKADDEDEEEEVMKSKSSNCGCNKYTTKSEVRRMIENELSVKGTSVKTPATKVDGQLKTKSKEEGMTLGDIVKRASSERNFAPDMPTLIDYIKE
jgi:hypothetical protein